MTNDVLKHPERVTVNLTVEHKRMLEDLRGASGLSESEVARKLLVAKLEEIAACNPMRLYLETIKD